jgi:hypothetical protein
MLASVPWHDKSRKPQCKLLALLRGAGRFTVHLCRAGESLRAKEMQTWAQAEADHRANLARTKKLRKRYREHLARVEAAEQAAAAQAAQAQRDADRKTLLAACSSTSQTPPSVTRQTLRRQAWRDHAQAASFTSLMVAELALAGLQIGDAPHELSVSAAAAPLRTPALQRSTSPLLLAGFEHSAADALDPPAVLSPDSQPVLQRARVSAKPSDDVLASTADAARYYAAATKGVENGVQESSPFVSRLLAASRGVT